MIYCPICGGKNFSVTEDCYALNIMNLPGVTARGITTHNCIGCGEKYIDYPTSDSFREDICASLVSTSRNLSAEEMVYLRKFSALSARGLASILGKHPVTVSNWENNKAEIPKGAEMLLRYRVAMKLRMPIEDVAVGSASVEVRVFNVLLASASRLVLSQEWGSTIENIELPIAANELWA